MNLKFEFISIEINFVIIFQRFNSINISLSSKQVSLTFHKRLENNQNILSKSFIDSLKGINRTDAGHQVLRNYYNFNISNTTHTVYETQF